MMEEMDDVNWQKDESGCNKADPKKRQGKTS